MASVSCGVIAVITETRDTCRHVHMQGAHGEGVKDVKTRGWTMLRRLAVSSGSETERRQVDRFAIQAGGRTSRLMGTTWRSKRS